MSVTTVRQIYCFRGQSSGGVKRYFSGGLTLFSAIRPIFCSKCGEDMYPEEILLKDQLSNKVINRRVLGKDIDLMGDAGDNYGSVLSEEEAELHEIGVSKQKSTFTQHEEEFWEAYTAFALGIWDRICRELTIKEINDVLITLDRPFYLACSHVGIKGMGNRCWEFVTSLNTRQILMDVVKKANLTGVGKMYFYITSKLTICFLKKRLKD